MNIGFIIDSLPPINRPSSNRGVAFIKELSKSHNLFVFSYSELSEKDLSVKYYFTKEELEKVKSFQIVKPANVKYLAGIRFLFRFSSFDGVTKQYCRKIHEVHDKYKLDLLIISIGPVERAKIGYLVNKKLHIPWILDYRDEWTSEGSQLYISNTFLNKINKVVNNEVAFEKKFTKDVKCFTTVFSDGLSHIESHIDKKGFLIENGFFLKNYNAVVLAHQRPVLKVAYLGTFYNSQFIPEGLIELDKLLQTWGVKIQVHFIGTNQALYKSSLGSISNEFRNIGLSLFPKIPLEQIYHDLPDYDALIHAEHFDQINVPSSKLYDYIALGLPVLLLKSYGGFMTSTLRKTKQLILLSEVDLLRDFLISFESRKKFVNDKNDQLRIEYSRESQMLRMNDVIKFSFLPK